MGSKKDPLKPLPILLDYPQLIQLRQTGVILCHATPLLSALRIIAEVARGNAYIEKPDILVEVGMQLTGLVPDGYWNHFNPPLSVVQLCAIMASPESIPYVRRVQPGVIGDMILTDLNKIVVHYS